MTKYYGIMPWDIGKLTLFQWQIYTEKIAAIYKMFHPEPKKGSGNSGRASKEEYIQAAKRRGIKLPTKGM